jgi:uncharacterized protein YyaL (SSP411 family)
MSMPNRLANETSPYLLQHKDNPVAWQPWDAAALAQARAENKPILVSIGYSACHWCHVMAHESFEDPETAALMNDWFVCIKVDREERPDIDALMMTAVQAITGHGGWPLHAFLTPDGHPFYGGTYWPKTDRQGMPAFSKVLQAVHTTWESKPEDVQENARQIASYIRDAHSATPAPGEIDDLIVDDAIDQLATRFDPRNGGFGGAPKFPQASVLELLIRAARRGNDRAAQMMSTTLDRMAFGGIHDQIGGGFHRYTVDAVWLVPHFEKMLYDNAQLARLYLDAWRLTKNDHYRRVAISTLDYVLREMTHEHGGFFSAQDADSEGIEGKFFVWSPSEIIAVLGEERGDQFNRWFDITPRGNFEGHSIPNQVATDKEIAAELQLTVDEARRTVDAWRVTLYQARSTRVWPGRDDKIVLSGNGMMLRAFAEAAAAFERPDYRDAALRNATFILDAFRLPDGRLAHVWTDGRLGVPAFLDDIAQYADGLRALYELTLDARWLDASIALIDQAIAEFANPDGPGFFDTSTVHEQLVARPRELQDGATPSGNAVMTELLLRLHAITEQQPYRDRAHHLLESLAKPMTEQPIGFGRALCAADLYRGPIREIAIAGKAGDEETNAYLVSIAARYEPNAVIGLSDPDQPEFAERFPFLQFRPQRDGLATAYLCERHTCLPPVTTPEALDKLLDKGTDVEWVSF